MWEQSKPFDLSKMGTRAGYCLANVRTAYGIGPKFASAKVDMENNRNKGWLHSMDTLPTNVAVPVYLDTASEFEHIMVADKGVFYSDGKRLTSTAGLKFFGWGESVNDIRVVEYKDQPKPEPTPAPAAPFAVGDTVVPTRLVSYDGIPLRQYDNTYTITQIVGDRVVLSARGAVWAAVNIKDIRKA